MSAATASVADGSRTDSSNRDDGRDRSNSGQPHAQCTPLPLPALGTQKIIQGNGTSVGTVISLQCPAKHKMMGSDLTCVIRNSSTQWDRTQEPFCKPLGPYEEYGFRVAVLASIVSSAIIFLMSVAFITCCLLDCIKEDKRKKEESESDMWQWEEQAQHQEDNRSRYSHKGRNNNNNTQEKMLSLWDTHNPAACDSVRACRCHQEYAYGPVCAYGPAAPLAALPGRNYDQPLLPRNPGSGAQLPAPPQYPGAAAPLAALPGRDYDQPLLPRGPESGAQLPAPPQYPGPPAAASCLTASPSLVQISAVGPGLVWQYGRQQSTFPGVNPPPADESSMRNISPAKEFSIRIISV